MKSLIKYFAWQILNPYILRLKKTKGLYKFNSSYRGLNLGCGLANPPTWIGIDGGVYLIFRSMPSVVTKKMYPYFASANDLGFKEFISVLKSSDIIHYNLLFGIPFDNDSIPAIYCSHFLEHLSYEDAQALLRECYRVLEKGGMIRICVPSLEVHVDEMRNAIKSYESGDVNAIQKYFVTTSSGFSNAFSSHRFMYDYGALRDILSKAGFLDIQERSYRKGNISDVKILDTRDGLFVETIK